jgi:hypothetical protein
MSHLALRRLMIRMLHDPLLVDAIYTDAARALAREEISDIERAWLIATPRAAWSTDPERPARVLAALLAEYPATARVAPERVATFFAGEPFHRAVRERGSLAAALGEHLAQAAGPLAAPLARLEAAIARIRRAPRAAPSSPAGSLRLAPNAEVLELPLGTLAAFTALRQGADPTELAEGVEDLLVLRQAPDGDVTVEEIPEGLAAVLRAAERSAGRQALAAIAREHGADPGEEAAILDGLVRDGLLG